ncbi:MAG: hypothetical protein KF787_02435 [Phycisphaeraceae bacterium]|nr:hypothetical protein [Phycisphaerae bacterium]MBX3391483.1 hypothetical protein [Phycisphaeraceae bacterium]
MNIALLFNPSSGNGSRAAAVDRIVASLRQDGHRVTSLCVGNAGGEGPDARRLLGASDLLIIAGGDGTVSLALPMVIEAGVPIRHVPLGTENLFARHFGMRADPGSVRAAVERREIVTIDTAEVDGRPFVIMFSAGPDANVVHRLAAQRRGGISHLSYVGPIIREALLGGVVPISLEVDGHVLFENRRGMAVVGNMAQYAMGANPARRASPTDGELDVVFFPSPISLAAGFWLAACKVGADRIAPGVVRGRGRHVVIVSEHPGFCSQADGEALPGAGGSPRSQTREIRIRPSSLRVLR